MKRRQPGTAQLVVYILGYFFLLFLFTIYYNHQIIIQMRGSPSPLLRTGPKEMDACTVGNQDNRLRERKEEGKKKMEKKELQLFF